jgi:surface protein
VRRVVTMRGMFEEATAFNQPLDPWDVGQVTTMENMFRAARRFNQPLSTWEVRNVTNMSRMFDGATAFQQSLDAWERKPVVARTAMATVDPPARETKESRRVRGNDMCSSLLKLQQKRQKKL